MSELGRRIIVALVGAPVALAMIWYGDAAIATLASALGAIGAWEFYRIARASGSTPMMPLGVVLAAMAPLLTHAHYLGIVSVPIVFPVLIVLAVIAAALWTRGVEGQPLAAAATTLLGAVYTGATLSFVYALRYHKYAVGDTAGALVVIMPVALTWASDIGAFFTGRLIGGPKLMPTVSPAKTISGAIGALVSTTAVCAAFVHYLLKPYAQLSFTLTGLLLFALVVSATAQIGDLVESMFKREAGVKDSGTFFPGHGGVLDRLDSLFFVLPVAFALYGWLLIPVPG